MILGTGKPNPNDISRERTVFTPMAPDDFSRAFFHQGAIVHVDHTIAGVDDDLSARLDKMI
jgi:hypothetical protein